VRRHGCESVAFLNVETRRAAVDTVIGEWVKAEGGEEGSVVAVAHAGGGTAGWQLLFLQPNLRLTTVSALNAQVVPTSEPLSEDEDLDGRPPREIGLGSRPSVADRSGVRSCAGSGWLFHWF
jgi:hypothetical protein